MARSGQYRKLLGLGCCFWLAMAGMVTAQAGTVKGFQKISETTGGFSGDLDPFDAFGHSSAFGPDLDGNGVRDLAVGANYDDDGADGAGAVWIIFLDSDGTVMSHQKISNTAGGLGGGLGPDVTFGDDVAWLGDMDGDGVGDLAVGSKQDDDGNTDNGAVWILFMNSDGTVKDRQKISTTQGGLVGPIPAHSQVGTSVEALGDLDGDGVVDIATGAQGDSDGGEGRGAVWVLFLNNDGTVKDEQKISDTQGGFTGSLANLARFGYSIANLGDLDEDGVVDLAVSVREDSDGGLLRGALWILFMNADGTVKAEQKISDTEGGFIGVLDDEDYFGRQVEPLGDLNGDGVNDLAAGAHGDDDGATDNGAVWILFLNADGTVNAHQKISGTAGGYAGGRLGGSRLASGSDVDGDGTIDLVVGDTTDDDGGADQGAVRVLFLNQARFVEVAAAAGGVDDSGSGGGVAWGDYDGDGDQDLYLSNWGSANRLYQNNGDGTFSETAAGAGVDDAGSGLAVAWADYDNDDDLDLFLSNAAGANRLYQNSGAGTFAEVAAAAGVDDAEGSSGAAWADYDTDGDLDLYLPIWGAANKLYQASGTGTFTDVAAAAGVNYAGNGRGVAWGDYDNDEDLDLYLANSGANLLYRNNGDGTFTEVGASAGVDDAGDGQGAAWGDYDNDEDLDLYVTSGGGQSRLYENNGDGSFTDVAAAAGVDAISGVGIAWADYDRDGNLDLYVTYQGGAAGGPHWLYHNNGNGTFSEVGVSEGTVGSGHGAGAAWGDYDGDGDLDLYVAQGGEANLLYRNGGDGNHWLTVALAGSVSSTNGIGARVTAVTGSTRQTREVEGGSGYLSQPSLAVEFGFGSASVVDSLIVAWPSGVEQVMTSVDGDQAITIVEPVELLATDTTATYTEALTIPLRLSNTTGAEMVSAEVSVSYDGDLLVPFSPAPSAVSRTLLTSAWTVAVNVVDGVGTSIDTIKVAMATDDDTLSGAGDLIELNFTVADRRSTASSPLHVAHALFNDGIPGSAVTDGSVTLVGTDGALVSAVFGGGSSAEVIPREAITVTVDDVDEDRDPATAESFSVRVTNGGQSETLTVDETGVATGFFSGTIATEFSETPGSGDGIVQAQAGDLIASCYDDSLDAVGATVERCHSLDVIGGSDGHVRVTAVSAPGDTVRVRVTDPDLNTDPATQEAVQVTVLNTVTLEAETLELGEVDSDDAVFFGIVQTAYSSASTGDGVIATHKADTLRVTYLDDLTAAGGTAALPGLDLVVDPFGDADGNGQAQAFDAARVLYHVLFPYLTGLDSLAANVDQEAPFDPIEPYDAALILKKRVGLVTRFEVQEDAAANHPQPETEEWVPKRAVAERQLALRAGDGHVSVWAAERGQIVSGELLIAGIDGSVKMADELGEFVAASRSTPDGLRIVFAGASPVDGAGELVRIYGTGTPRLSRARFNNGRIAGRTEGTQLAAPLPAEYALHANVPNPFNPTTTIRFDLPRESDVQLAVYDVLGQRLRLLASGALPAGAHQTAWDGRDQMGDPVGSGVYLCRLQSGDFVQVQRMLLLK